MTELRAVVALGLALSGCASTGGRDWLNSPIDERAPPLLSGADVTTSQAQADLRPRLQHTVTLGEVYAAPAERGAPPVGSAINVHTNVAVTVNNQVGSPYGYGYGYPSSAYRVGPYYAPTRTTTRSSETKVGADFPAPPDYGPRALK